jgi:heptosyltransferase II
MKIAVLRYRFIGDSVLSLPFLEQLRAQYPQATIHLWTGPDAHELMTYSPSIDACFSLEPRRQGFLKAAWQLRQHGYDRVYILKRSLSSALLAWLSGASERIGFATEGRQLLLTQAIPYGGSQAHEAGSFLSLLGAPTAIWTPQTIPLPRLQIPNQVTSAILDRFWPPDSSRPVFLIHPHSSNSAKAWPLEHVRTLLQRLDAGYAPTFLELGPASEASLNDSVFENWPTSLKGQRLPLCGKTSVLESFVLLSAVDVAVTSDSGVMHLAALAGRPQVAVFGPSSVLQWQPLSDKAIVLTTTGLDCQPCGLKITCDHRFPCLWDVTPEQVFAAVEQHL